MKHAWIVDIILASFLIAAAECLQETSDDKNVTSLFPVNTTKIEKSEEEVINITDVPSSLNENKTNENESKGKTDSNGEGKNTKFDTAIWHIDAKLVEPNIKDNSRKLNKTENKVFKPSQQLGTFYGENAFIVPKLKDSDSFTPVINNPSVNHNSSPNDVIKTKLRIPYYPTPYKYEDVKLRDNSHTLLDSKPTAEVPVKIPAGGLYKYPDPFKEKPSSDGGHDDFGLEFDNDSMKNSMKKRQNPWHTLLNLVTALLPVGIIISALTPGLVTLHTTGNKQQSVSDVSDLPPVSERCRRRLLRHASAAVVAAQSSSWTIKYV
ncbi:unnamed protein product [Leptidea sinapis]|uniref:Uncharacterized protein n=1 Tax=Leptidea sinapis TaxID=189913 RepID=A0A5E4PTP3_9NEOP|nr:unnamed protein product [Leptidea sinapis]